MAKDKILHIVIGFLIAAVVIGGCISMSPDGWFLTMLDSVVIAGAAYSFVKAAAWLKEAYDQARPLTNTAEVFDAHATEAGGLLAIGLFLIWSLHV
jgi:hypothetical protein